MKLKNNVILSSTFVTTVCNGAIIVNIFIQQIINGIEKNLLLFLGSIVGASQNKFRWK